MMNRSPLTPLTMPMMRSTRKTIRMAEWRKHPAQPRWMKAVIIEKTVAAIQTMTSAAVSTNPFFACHCTSGSFFSTRRGIRARSHRYERTTMTLRFGLTAPPGGGGMVPPGGGGGVYDGGGGTFGSRIAEVSFPRNDYDPLTSVYPRAI